MHLWKPIVFYSPETKFKLSYLGCGSITERNTEYAEECNHIRNVDKKVTVGGGAKGADLHNSEKEQNL